MKGSKANIVARAIILDKKGRVLLGKRTQGKYAGCWALIGGKPKKNETIKETIIREVKEELGIKFHPDFYLEKSDEESIPGELWKVSYFVGRFVGEFVLNDEISEIKFVSLDDLKKLETAFDHREILTKYFKLSSGMDLIK